MTEIVTDLGTLRLLSSLGPSGAPRLRRFVDDCARGRGGSETFEGWMFDGWPDLRRVELDYDPNDRRKGRVVATCTFAKATWRRGSLRIPGIELPQAIMLGIKGRRIGEVVEGSPFPDFVISHAVHDRKQGAVTLRIRCDGETLAPIARG